MCPHGYHHSGSMTTPALGTRDVRLHIYITIYITHIYNHKATMVIAVRAHCNPLYIYISYIYIYDYIYIYIGLWRWPSGLDAGLCC